MKNYLFAFIMVFILIVPSLAQETGQQKLMYQHKIESFTKLNNAGNTITACGAGVGILGIIFYSTAPDKDEESFRSDDEASSGYGLMSSSGVVCICIGVGLVAGGITMASIGSYKRKSYKQKLDNLSLGVTHQGITLAYRF